MTNMTKNTQQDRWRCCITRCNPKLIGYPAALEHKQETGHRIARWPVRSAYGKAQAHLRGVTGYYDKYNVGAKSAFARGLVPASKSTSLDMGGSICQDETGEDYWGDSNG